MAQLSGFGVLVFSKKMPTMLRSHVLAVEMPPIHGSRCWLPKRADQQQILAAY